MKRLIFLASFFACNALMAQNSLSVNILKPVFYFAGKQDFMTDITFEHYLKDRMALRFGLHGGYKAASSGFELNYFKDSDKAKYTVLEKHSLGLGLSIGLKYHPHKLLVGAGSSKFYWLFQGQGGVFIDRQFVDVTYPCCNMGPIQFNTGFFKLGLLAGYDIRLKSLLIQPELGMLFPWAAATRADTAHRLSWVNEIRFQWHIGLNRPNVF